jgi:hypothetical protein
VTVRFVTRSRPKVDRVACPWLVARFVDPRAEFHFAPAAQVAERARELDAIPFDVEGVELSHVGERCSFDAFLEKYELADPALHELATIVRGADTARPDLAPECAGLLAVSLGLSQLYEDDHEQLSAGFLVYDALFAWLTRARGETHTWNPQRGR